MHDWYSQAYFSETLPIRRQSETAYQTLAQLKTATGNAVQPFLSHVRPRNPPPNLPIPLSLQPNSNVLADQFTGLSMQNNIHTPIMEARQSPLPSAQLQQAFANQNYNPAFAPAHYGGQPGFGIASPGAGYHASPGPQWGASPQTNIAARMNGMNNFGLNNHMGAPSPIGSAPLAFLPQQNQPMYSPVIGGPAQRMAGNDFFSPSVGVGAIAGSPWGAPQPPQPVFQQPLAPSWAAPAPAVATFAPVPAPALTSEPVEPAPETVNEPSYFPEGAQAKPEEAVPVSAATESETPVVQEEATKVEQVDDEEAAVTPIEDIIPNSPKAAPVSAWGQKASVPAAATPTRAAALIESAPSQASPAIKPISTPAPAPAKPVKLNLADIATPEKVERPTTPGPKVAPWAISKDSDKPATPSGPGLREIQQAEAKQAESRKQALAEARAASASPAPFASAKVVSTTTDEMPTSVVWGLPAQGGQGQRTPAQGSPSIAQSAVATPVWGAGETAPKKTLKQIQEEEEKRRAKVAAQVKAAQVAAGIPAAAKRGYADLAANTAAVSTLWAKVIVVLIN
jgi:PERQ amino acid-rich with GYF domain-containing protein